MDHEIPISALDNFYRGGNPGSAFMGNRIGAGVEYARPERSAPDSANTYASASTGTTGIFAHYTQGDFALIKPGNAGITGTEYCYVR